MVEVIGDVVIPSEFIVPQPIPAVTDNVSGALILSGGKLRFNTGGGWESVTST